MKLCTDCRHHFKRPIFRPEFELFFDECHRKPPARRTSIVNGKIETDEYDLCEAVRQFGWIESRLFGHCGKEGRFFEPRSAECHE